MGHPAETKFDEDKPIEKRCRHCNEMKPLEAFSQQKGGVHGRRSWCRACVRDYENTPEAKIKRKKRNHKTAWKAYKERRTERDPEWQKRKYQLEQERRKLSPERYAPRPQQQQNALYHRKYRIKKIYNLTEEEYQEMHEMQNGICAICGQPQSGRKKNLDIDHNHTTGEIRGLLGDDTTILEKAITYLQRFQT